MSCLLLLCARILIGKGGSLDILTGVAADLLLGNVNIASGLLHIVGVSLLSHLIYLFNLFKFDP